MNTIDMLRIVVLTKLLGLEKAKVSTLAWMTIAFALAGAVSSLVFTIGWMAWYEKTTGYSSGNAPLGWMFFYGPASAAFGQLLALVVWWFKKPGISSKPMSLMGLGGY